MLLRLSLGLPLHPAPIRCIVRPSASVRSTNRSIHQPASSPISLGFRPTPVAAERLAQSTTAICPSFPIRFSTSQLSRFACGNLSFPASAKRRLSSNGGTRIACLLAGFEQGRNEIKDRPTDRCGNWAIYFLHSAGGHAIPHPLIKSSPADGFARTVLAAVCLSLPIPLLAHGRPRSMSYRPALRQSQKGSRSSKKE